MVLIVGREYKECLLLFNFFHSLAYIRRCVVGALLINKFEHIYTHRAKRVGVCGTYGVRLASFGFDRQVHSQLSHVLRVFIA